jgi:hypothetical protein
MDVVELDAGDLPCKLYMDAYAAGADGVILINRIKPHTDFHGPIESGLMKMSIIGLGKHHQAKEIHSFGVYGLRELMPIASRRILETGKIIFGVGVVENAYHKVNQIKVARPEEIEKTEMDLLSQSRAFMPSLPLSPLDVLLVDQLGKDISGSGMDTNIIGRMCIYGEPEPDFPKIRTIIVDDLSQHSHGNAQGTGLADFITKKLRDKIDLQSTYENSFTSTFERRAFLPIITDTPAQAIEYALRLCGNKPVQEADIIRIRDTLSLTELLASDSALEKLESKPGITTLERNVSLFDENGDLTPWQM